MKDYKKSIKKQNVGATVIHKSKFENLKAHLNKTKVTQEFINKWTIPYYLNLNNNDEEWIEQISRLKPTITDEIILKNLGDFNWRTRQTGSFFASVTEKKEMTDIIGVHLLKSEVCYAGVEYIKTLVSFNTEKAITYLNEYLAYYLLQNQLYFDQITAISGLKYLDNKNGTNEVENHLENWKKYMDGKGSDEINMEFIEKQIMTSNKIIKQN